MCMYVYKMYTGDEVDIAQLGICSHVHVCMYVCISMHICDVLSIAQLGSSCECVRCVHVHVHTYIQYVCVYVCMYTQTQAYSHDVA